MISILFCFVFYYNKYKHKVNTFCTWLKRKIEHVESLTGENVFSAESGGSHKDTAAGVAGEGRTGS